MTYSYNSAKRVVNDDGTVSISFGVVNYKGEIVTRTKDSHPYNYDGFLIWKTMDHNLCTGSVYTDRLFQWDYKLTTDLIQKHFGTTSQYFDKYQPKELQAFLRERLNAPTLEVVFLQEECNQASGYPLWYIGYRLPETEECNDTKTS